MNKYRLLIMTGLSVLAFTGCTVAQDQPQSSGKRVESGQERRPPPPEAFTACDTLSLGAVCGFDTPKGEMKGTCQSPLKDGDLVCAPSGGKRPPR